MTFSIESILNNIAREEIDFLPKIKPKNKLKFPCSICNTSVRSNQKAIQCDSCNLWVHTKCDCISEAVYYEYMENELKKDEKWYCLVCKIRKNHEHFPFTLYNEVELNNINSCESMKMLENLPKFEIISEISKFSNLNSPIPSTLPERSGIPAHPKSICKKIVSYRKSKILGFNVGFTMEIFNLCCKIGHISF